MQRKKAIRDTCAAFPTPLSSSNRIGNFSAAKLPTRDEARRIAVNIANERELLHHRGEEGPIRPTHQPDALAEKNKPPQLGRSASASRAPVASLAISRTPSYPPYSKMAKMVPTVAERGL